MYILYVVYVEYVYIQIIYILHKHCIYCVQNISYTYYIYIQKQICNECHWYKGQEEINRVFVAVVVTLKYLHYPWYGRISFESGLELAIM